jgi:hypothetical protein
MLIFSKIMSRARAWVDRLVVLIGILGRLKPANFHRGVSSDDLYLAC